MYAFIINSLSHNKLRFLHLNCMQCDNNCFCSRGLASSVFFQYNIGKSLSWLNENQRIKLILSINSIVIMKTFFAHTYTPLFLCVHACLPCIEIYPTHNFCTFCCRRRRRCCTSEFHSPFTFLNAIDTSMLYCYGLTLGRFLSFCTDILHILDFDKFTLISSSVFPTSNITFDLLDVIFLAGERKKWLWRRVI